ncbi:hypothetical protein EMIHUDRAFT_200366 [Emiliania huxleyi CCMP1516]|uniref:ATPase AAA-type core domain-containing protein n=2 Tax=Emiliania huxleyi TaxID=2903 RepID=A0A0D3KQG0_EMIH1|nr:hypothetical protein EMIHUDRAFT_200366 [Emiliania huxleyi CCMP1516]EOD37995.1 hypothetical protein EMIHUDRAFT_200366 [Emiliania huxleyi CCMP1516]|eukprot:XP_005790424.1 hypothetical protein EMIHUDRAFT_200366 [Emiliania huxleyi CCMP1516]
MLRLVSREDTPSAAKEALTQAVLLPLRHPASFAAAPLRLRSGALLHGPPGCGKTSPLHQRVSGPELLDKYIGASEAKALGRARGCDSTGVTDRVALGAVFVLAASSRPELIDPALLRPGRIDLAVACGLPDEEERLAILAALARPLGLPLASLRRLAAIAAATAGYSGAELRADENSNEWPNK